MNGPTLHPDDEARAIKALVALDWMEFPFESSSEVITRLLGCTPEEATAVWKGFRKRGIIEMKSRFNVQIGRGPLRSAWKWFRVEK